MAIPYSQSKKILIMGLPGSGKTTLSVQLARLLNAVHFNADEVRTEINTELGFSIEDRLEHARRMGWLCDQVVKTDRFVIADFVCPTNATRDIFGDAYVVWVDRIAVSRYEDTNAIFEPPTNYNIRVEAHGNAEAWAELIAQQLLNSFDPAKPAALFVGRYQPFHEGHKKLIIEGIKRVGQACIGVRNMSNASLNNPFSFPAIKDRIEFALSEYRGRFDVINLPNITNIFYGRDVGYNIEEISLPVDVKNISATKIRGDLEQLILSNTEFK